MNFFKIIFVALLFALNCAVSSAVTIPPPEIMKNGLEALHTKQYEESIKFFKEFLSYSPPSDAASYGFYYMALSYVQLEKKDEALSALQSASDNGFAEWKQVLSEPLLTPIKNTPEFSAILENFKTNANIERVYHITLWDNPNLGWFSLHEFSDYDHPKSKKLRELYRLDTLIANKPTQLQKQMSAMNWVHNLWVHDPMNVCKSLDALSILKEVKAGKRFRCVEYAVVLSEVLSALGFPARAIELNKEGMSFGVGKSHAVTEVWNDDYRKWIMLDPQNNAIWTKKDTILSAFDIHKYFVGKDSASLNKVSASLYPSKWRDSKFNPQEWIKYFYYLSYRYDNTLLENPESHQLMTTCLLSEGQKPELLNQGFSRQINYTTSVNLIYPSLNRVHIDINAEPEMPADEPEDSQFLLVDLSNSMPWFDHYIVEINGNPNFLRSEAFRWELVSGFNTLHIKPVNKAGVEGREAKVEVRFFQPKE